MDSEREFEAVSRVVAFSSNIGKGFQIVSFVCEVTVENIVMDPGWVFLPKLQEAHPGFDGGVREG